MIEQLRESLRAWIDTLQLGEQLATLLEATIGVAAVLAVAFGARQLIERVVGMLFPVFLSRLHTGKRKRWLEALQQRVVAGRIARIVAVLIVDALVPHVLSAYPATLTVIQNIIQGYLVAVMVMVINALIGATSDVFSGESEKNEVPLRIATQATQGAVVVVGLIVGFSVVFDRPVTVLLSGLAGATALVMLLFKDSILGFVAGIQLSQNDMLRIGDWIEVPQYGANGTVQDVRLTCVKVQNFDKTITTIPTYALVSGSFKNWRGMKESGARRIKSSVRLDMDSIHFLSEQETQELKHVSLLKAYLEGTLSEIESHNNTLPPDARHPPNARALTNLGAFRAYLEKYLECHPALNEDMVILVRHLDPGPEGLPIEIYGFSKQQDWEEYERIQSNIFEHILAVLPVFGLRVYQAAKSIH